MRQRRIIQPGGAKPFDRVQGLGDVSLLLLTAATMIAFAGNSILARLALIEGEIGAGSFALIRLLSGAVILCLLCWREQPGHQGSWRGGAALAVYAVFFAFAYLALPTGTGAVILFAVVQFTMIAWGLAQGERLNRLQIAGATVSAACLVWLVSPGLAAPPLLGSVAMICAGLGWGAYSIIGKTARDPLPATAGNFLRASALCIVVLAPLLFFQPEPFPNPRGVVLALLSGAVTSGLGYALWYTVLPHLGSIRAGVSQLTVPAIAAVGGVLFLSEPITWRFAIATTGILGGVALAVLTLPPRSTKADL